MYRTQILPDGTIHLGEAARAAGYAPGQLVDVVLSSTGSLYVVPADLSEAIDVPAISLPAGRERRALVEGRASGRRRG